MIIKLIQIVFWTSACSCFVALRPVVASSFGNSQLAVANSVRCLDTIQGDDYRIALNRSWAAENLASLGDDEAAIRVLEASSPHYLIPFGCVSSALSLWGAGQTQPLRQLLDLAIARLPLAVGRGGEQVLLQTVKMATLLEYPQAVDKAWALLPEAKKTMQPAYQSFLQDWRPNPWNRLLDWLRPDRQWKDLKQGADRKEQTAWSQSRAADAFTALLLIKEAEACVRRGQRYPALWVEFARAGARATSPSTRPIAIQTALASLAALEGRKREALTLARGAAEMTQPWAPQMAGVYTALRDLAVLVRQEEFKPEDGKFFLEQINFRKKVLLSLNDSYEKMLQLPLLAEAFYALGDEEQAQAAWKTTAELCAQNQNPESQSIGLTRIWMSLARANTWPDKETEALLLKTEKQLPEAYSKVNF